MKKMSLANFRKVYGKNGSGRFVVSEGTTGCGLNPDLTIVDGKCLGLDGKEIWAQCDYCHGSNKHHTDWCQAKDDSKMKYYNNKEEERFDVVIRPEPIITNPPKINEE